MARTRNESSWLELYDQLPFLEEGGPHSDEMWRLLEEIEKDGHLHQIDIMRLARLLEIAYKEGQESMG